MKIRNFYQFNESFEFYYGLITFGQYQRLFNNLIRFNKSDYEFLSNLISNKYQIDYRINNIHIFPDDEKGFTNKAPQITIRGKENSYIISKKRDEYFIVEICESSYIQYLNRHGQYYYCDQLDGLSKFLTDEGVTKDIKETKKENDTLYIFDLDDTLFLNPRFEDLAIEYLKEDVTVKSLLQSSIRKIGVTLSSLKWENGKIYIPDPNHEIEVKSNWIRRGKRVYLVTPDKFYYTDLSLPIKTTELSKLYNSVENKAIVTGRPLDIKDKIKNSLKEFNLDDPNYGLHCYPAKRGTSERVADWKAKTIVNLIKDNKFKKVYFYDDNSKWVNRVTREVKKELPDIDWNPIKYKYKNG